jgi:hypothetical protein
VYPCRDGALRRPASEKSKGIGAKHLRRRRSRQRDDDEAVDMKTTSPSTDSGAMPRWFAIAPRHRDKCSAHAG